jgi:hypothetical protein
MPAAIKIGVRNNAIQLNANVGVPPHFI